MQEIWKPVVSHPLDYEVSNLGRVRSIKFPKVVILKPGGRGRDGKYMGVGLTMNGKSKTYSVHSLVAEAFIGPRPDGMQVNHKDLNKSNNRADNLEYATPLQNTAHAHRHLNLKGSGNAMAKLNEAQVEVIKRGLRGGIQKAKLARRFNVHWMTIHAIDTGRTWAHVS